MSYRLSCFICLLFLAVLPAKAQVNFATYVNLSAKINAVNVRNGEAVIHTEKNRLSILGTFKNGKLTLLYAKDTKGNRLNAVYSSVKQNCDICFRLKTDGRMFCYDLDCRLIPAAHTGIKTR